MTEHSEPRRAKIANCSRHGLHGERTDCFLCGAPVEQVPMRLDTATEADVEAVARWLAENGLRSWTWDNIPRKPTMSRPAKDEFREKARMLLSTIFKEGGEGS